VSAWIREAEEKDISESSKPSKFNLYFIADYSPERGLSFTEVEQSVKAESDRIEDFNCVPVRPFNTLEAGFVLNQLTQEPLPENSFIFLNVAPRRDDNDARDSNSGEELVLAGVGGVPVVATASGYSLSFVKDRIDRIFGLDVDSQGSQFRSRDIFPEAVGRIMKGDSEVIEEELDLEIQDPPENSIAYIDGFGNLKTTLRRSDAGFEEGEGVRIAVNGEEVAAKYQEGIFGVEEGEVVLAPGSSGGEDPFLEIVVRGGSAEKELGDPEPGDEVDSSDSAN
jgi:hypothetical protein